MRTNKSLKTELYGVDLQAKQEDLELSSLVSVGTILGETIESCVVNSNYVVYIGTSLPERNMGVVDLFVPSSSFSYFNGLIMNFNGHVLNVSSYLPMSSSLYKNVTLSYFFYELYSTLYVSYCVHNQINQNIINVSTSQYVVDSNRVVPLVL